MTDVDGAGTRVSGVMSMTGFGSATFEVAGEGYRIDVKAVNHRSLNVRLHTPPGFDHVENAVTRTLRERLDRGSISVHVDRLGGSAPDFLLRHLEVIVEVVANGPDRGPGCRFQFHLRRVRHQTVTVPGTVGSTRATWRFNAFTYCWPRRSSLG